MRAYVFFSVLEEFFFQICKRLVDAESLSDFSGTVWGIRSVRLLEQSGMDSSKLLLLSRVFRELPRKVDYRFLRTYEETADGLPMPLVVAADRVLCSRPYDEGTAHVEAALRAVEGVFDRYSPDILLADDVSCIPSYAHYLVAKRRGIPVVMLGISRIPGRLAVYSNPMAIPEDLVCECGRIQSHGLSQNERAVARSHINDFRQHAAEIDYMRYMSRAPGLRIRELPVLWKLWLDYRKDPLDYTAIPPAKALADRIRRVARYRFLSASYEQPVPGENYVLFPLHYQPEASTSVRAPFFLDQCALAENIARALPAGYRLYVKEHAARLGSRSVRDLQRLRSIPSVRVIDPHADVRALVRNAACVAVITSTMGWEALLLGVPVVLFGEAFYGVCENVFRAGSPRDYPRLFREAIAFRAPDEILEEFVAAVMNTTFPGCMGHPHYLPSVIEQKNIQQIADAVAKRCLAPRRAEHTGKVSAVAAAL